MTYWFRMSLGVAVLVTAAGTVRAADSGTLRGLLFAADSSPMSNVVVTIDGEPRSTTDADGAFLVDLPVGQHTVVITPAGSKPIERAVGVGAGQTTELIIALEGAVAVVDVEEPPLAAREESQEPSSAAGILEGRVADLETGEPLAGARVFVRGADVEALTTGDGRFRLRLAPGAWDLSVLHVGHSTQTLAGVAVKAGQTVEVAVQMTPAAKILGTLTVVAPRLEGGTASFLEERRSAASVSDVLGGEQMSKAGDSDAAAALQRVTGLTIVDGKYVYVRGLGDRYSSALLNGSTLPSPEPERRVIPLDVFPTKLLEGVVIPKTYSVDLPGEFGGGSIQLRTRPIPTGPIRQLELSIAGQPGTTFSTGQRYDGGSLDFLGVDDGSRALPSKIKRASTNSPLKERDRFSDTGYTTDQLEQFGEMMPNAWKISAATVPPALGVSAVVGDRLTLLGKPVGYLSAVTYGDGWESNTEDRTYYLVGADNQLEPAHSYAFEWTERSVRLGGVLNLGAELGAGNTVGATTTLVRTTSDEARTYEGYNKDVDSQIRVSRLRWIERMLVSQQLTGSHTFDLIDGLTLDWRYTFSLASRYEPDRREYRYDFEPTTGEWMMSDRPEGNQRVFSDLSDSNHDVGVSAKLPVPGLPELQVQSGLALVFKDRTVDTRRYKYLHKGPLSNDSEVLRLSPEEIFTPDYIGPQGFQFEEITRQTDNYSADQRIYAGYLRADASLPSNLRLVAGMRVEHSGQRVETFELFNPSNEPVVADLTKTDFLPALSVVWQPAEQLAIRAAASRTVSRPELRELSPATFNDVTGGRQVFGNAELERATILHGDARLEWYPSPSEVVSLGAFVKSFDKPIESVVVVSAQHSVTYENAKGARNYGVELEMRKWLGFVHRWLADVYVAGNGAIVRSQVNLKGNSGIQTSNERPLQGQSPYVVNAELGYTNVDTGIDVALLYNVFGRRITEVGALGAPDIYEEPVHRVDFSAAWKINSYWKVSLKARNLLDPAVERRQGGLVTQTQKRGREANVGVSFTF